ncbi:hypothetical protein Q5425_37765 [Amycolatopsis sp. A133]|uniref:hypothetical protein n=1 Tax=Amycolatopsis sp. A133 TaxID=3064472 RepID=UPI0027E85553|nr:hypothetical protein [Amycolatopsis sp. A133]MDQ7809504.1 hypothetical protein [Amycolatopsis sp. A133]
MAGLVLTGTSACTVPHDAVAGISVTDDGHLLGVILVCGHHIDGATLYHSEGRGEVVDEVIAPGSVPSGSWTADRPLESGLATWPLESPAAGWGTDTPLAPLSAETTYTFFGWTHDSSSSAQAVEFTLADRARLTPGKVLHFNGGESAAVVPMAEFQAGACSTL